MIRPTISIKGKVSTNINIKGKVNSSTIRIYPELENIEIVPTLEDQVFKSKKYGFEEIKLKGVDASIDEDIKPENIKEGAEILGVAGSFKGIDTSDATALSEDILVGKTAYVNNQKIEGTMEEYDGSYEGNVSEEVKITDASYLFYYGSRLDIIQDLLKICKNVTGTASMFYYASNLKTLDLSSLDTSNVVKMNNMFHYCENLLNINFSNFNTKNAQTMYSMFDYCKKLQELNLKSFDTTNVTTMAYMFRECQNIIDLDLSNFNTENVTQMEYMFYRLYKITSLNLNSFNTSKVKSMSNMFCQCSVLENLDLSNFDASNVSDITYIFYSDNKLTNLRFMKNLGKGYIKTQNNYSYYELYLKYTSNLSHESLMDIINNLYDLNLTYNVANGGTLYTQKLTLGETLLSKLTAEEIAIATNKGWTVS